MPWAVRLAEGRESSAPRPVSRLAIVKEQEAGRWAEPSEIAHAMLYLVSPQARFVTGQVLCISGGQTIT